MPAVGDGVAEIRVRSDGAFRVLYVAKFAEGVVVLHAFQKKSQRTSRPDLEIAIRRYREFLLQRKRK
jgi:phage-related protein